MYCLLRKAALSTQRVALDFPVDATWLTQGTLQEAIYKRQVFRESPKWNKRIAARALFRTAREIALGMQHLHNSNVLHGNAGLGNILTCISARA